MSVLCLQGGAEFQPGCEAMDADVLAASKASTASQSADRPPRVVVAPFAGRPGREREIAYANAERWYRGLGAQDVRPCLDEGTAFADALAEADLLVLPGGSPSRLLAALQPHRAALAVAVEQGLSVSGASAGAMVLCRWTVLPDAPGSGRGAPRVVEALGIADVDLVLVHYRASGGRNAWLEAARPLLPQHADVLGLPERSGVIVEGGERRAAGAQAYVVL